MVIATWRAVRRFLLPRLILSVGAALVIVIAGGVSSLLTLAIAFAGMVVITALEQRVGHLLAEARS